MVRKPCSRYTPHPQHCQRKFSHPSLRTATGQQLSTKYAQRRVWTAQGTLNGAQAPRHIPGAGRAKTLKAGKKRSTGSGTVGNRHAQTLQTEMPQIMAVAVELRQPLTDAIPRETSLVVGTVPMNHCTNRHLDQQQRRKNRTDDIRAEVLVWNTEIGQETDRTTTHHTAESMHAKAFASTVDKDRKAPIEPMSVQATLAAGKGADRRARRRQFTPTFDIPLAISAERTRLSAWFRRWFWGCRSCQTF
jgi:hypothetical protein